MTKEKDVQKNGIETRHDEVRFTTSDPAQMLGQYIAAPLRKRWTEDFVDGDTGEVVSIERFEVIERRGDLIDPNILSRIQFHIQAGDITEVEVSNQNRAATLLRGYCHPYSVTARIDRKKRKFLLYATSVFSALEIAQDYIELNFTGTFEFTQVKAFDYCIFLKDNLKRADDDETTDTDKDFYMIEIEVLHNDFTSSYAFVLQTSDVDSGMIVIYNYLSEQIREQNEKSEKPVPTDFTTTIKAAKVIPCYRIIDKEFSDAYMKRETEQ